jgi:hypothetical protein
MPGPLLHMGATVTCAHSGQATPLAPSPRVTVSGSAIVTKLSPYSVAGCTLPPPPAGNGPCVTAQFLSFATRVVSDGAPVLLMDSQATCLPTGTPLLISTVQTRVSGI